MPRAAVPVTALAIGILGAGGASAANLAAGKATYELWCAGCHAAHGTPGRPEPAGTAILQIRYQGKVPAVLTDRTDLTAAYIALMVRHGRNAMPFFRKTEITDAQLRDLAAWLTRARR